MSKQDSWALRMGLSASILLCGHGWAQQATGNRMLEGGGPYPAPSATPTVTAPADPAATQAVNEARELAPMSAEQAAKQTVASPAPGSRTGENVSKLNVGEALDSGSDSVIVTIAFLVALGAVILAGAVFARRRGHLRSRASQIVVILVFAAVAALVWVGPATFLIH
jgi:hypothetical protein